MRIRRGFLFWGLFLIPIGLVPLLVRAGVLPEDMFTDVWRFWPVLLIALGVALLLGRSQASLIGTVLIALVLGTLAGAALASGNVWLGGFTDCASTGSGMSTLDRNGTFSGAASTTVELDCGSLDVAVKPGSDWTVHADYRGTEPRVESGPGRLTLRSPDGSGSHRQEWTVNLGADAIRDLALKVNAASSSIVLAGANLSRLTSDMNAADLLIDGTGATIDTIDASVNAGRMRVTLVGPSEGDLSANAGAIELCVPPDAALQLQVKEQLTFATNLNGRGLTKDGDTWTRAGTGGLIDLTVEGNAASFTLDPEGGCK